MGHSASLVPPGDRPWLRHRQPVVLPQAEKFARLRSAPAHAVYPRIRTRWWSRDGVMATRLTARPSPARDGRPTPSQTVFWRGRCSMRVDDRADVLLHRCIVLLGASATAVVICAWSRSMRNDLVHNSSHVLLSATNRSASSAKPAAARKGRTGIYAPRAWALKPSVGRMFYARVIARCDAIARWFRSTDQWYTRGLFPRAVSHFILCLRITAK